MTKLTLERRATFGWGATAAGSANPQNGFVIHFDGNDQHLASKSHSVCRQYWKDTRKFHMGPSRGWRDIGYSFAVCPHGIAMEGRGLNHEQAAQPGGNTTWYSISTIGGPHERPTKEQVAAIGALGAWIMKQTRCRSAVSEHRRFISTDCPGPYDHQLVVDGTFHKAILSAGAVTTPGKPKPGGTAPGFPGTYLSQPPVMKGHGTKAWQAQMEKRGWTLKPDDAYGPKSESVCRRFQAEKGLRIDGVVGPITWRESWSAPIT